MSRLDELRSKLEAANPGRTSGELYNVAEKIHGLLVQDGFNLGEITMIATTLGAINLQLGTIELISHADCLGNDNKLEQLLQEGLNAGHQSVS